MAGLAPSARDFAAAKPSRDPGPETATVTAINHALDRWAANDFHGAMQAIAQTDATALRTIGQRIVDGRRAEATTAADAFARLSDAFAKRSTTSTTALAALPAATVMTVGSAPSPGVVVAQPEALLRVSPTSTAATPSTDKIVPPLRERFERQPTAPINTARVVMSAIPTARSVLDWAMSDPLHQADAQLTMSALEHMGVDAAKLAIAGLRDGLLHAVDVGEGVLSGFDSQMDIQPVGILNLERIEFEPAGIERGELIYSVPMAPGEEVNITHMEWSNTSREFESIVQDSLENFSETGVTEKSELAQTTQSQSQHSSSLSAGVTASGGYGPVSITTSVSGTVASAASQSAQDSRKSSMDLTRKASSRAKQEHKTSFKVASASGTQDQAVRRLVNPFADKAARVDYYQLMRKWEVNHYRYGMRLTYDLTIPEPGSDVMSRIREIDRLTTVLTQGFGASGANEDWARFDLVPEDITRDNYMQHAGKYGAAVPAPPTQYQYFDVYKTHSWKTEDDANHNEFFSLEVAIPEGYTIDMVDRNRNATRWTDHDDFILGWQDVSDFIGVSGTRSMIYQTKWLGSLYVELRVRAALDDAPYNDWRLKAWSALHDAAKSRYDEQRTFLQDTLSKLAQSLGAQDALSLRKAELDEIMKGVLRFLFGPDFAFNPSGLPDDLYGANETLTSKKLWSKVIAWGKVIDFLHQAIEWENVLYFLFPYFWSNISRWEEKKYLDHPDPLHREFLKAGSARVVLTIRPGFERDFISLLETGVLGNTHPYMTIVDQMEDYAKTNFPGIPPANPEAADAAHKGVLIGTWYEYMPTSATDIAFNETTPTE